MKRLIPIYLAYKVVRMLTNYSIDRKKSLKVRNSHRHHGREKVFFQKTTQSAHPAMNRMKETTATNVLFVKVLCTRLDTKVGKEDAASTLTKFSI